MSEKYTIDYWNKYFQKIRGIILLPVLKLLSKIGLSANFITNFRFILATIALFYYYFSLNLAGAIVLFGISLLLDTIDGALARFQDNASDRGKFLDVFVDSITYSFIVLLIFCLNPAKISPVINIFLVPPVYLLATIWKNEGQPTDWIIKTYPRLGYPKAVVLIAFLSDYFGWTNGLVYFGLYLSNILCGLLVVYYYFGLQNRWFWRKNK